MSKLANALNIVPEDLPSHEVIDAHLVAYQARDLERFASYFSDDITGTRNGQNNLNGIAQLREIYGPMFSISPSLRVRISARRIEGEYIYDTEHVIGHRGIEKEITATVRYKVVNGKIVEMRLQLL